MSEQRAAFLAAIAADPTDTNLLAVFADWLEERGDPEAKVYRLASGVAPMPPAEDWRKHITILEPTPENLAGYHGSSLVSGAEQIVSFSPEAERLILALSNVGCRLFSMRPMTREHLDSPASQWRLTCAGYCLSHAKDKTGSKWSNDLAKTIASMTACRDFCRLVGVDDAAMEIQDMVPAAIRSTLENVRVVEMLAAEKAAEEVRVSAGNKIALAYAKVYACRHGVPAASKRATIVLGHGGQEDYDADAYSKKYTRSFGGARWRNAGVRVVLDGRKTWIVVENHLGREVHRIGLTLAKEKIRAQQTVSVK